jgi:hypothetical protein
MSYTKSALELNREAIDFSFNINNFIANPQMFSHSVVYLSQSDLQQTTRIITNIERVLGYAHVQKYFLGQEQVLVSGGVCMGYDFHLTSQGPRLIEINTNAGGLLLNLELMRAHSLSGLAFETNIDEVEQDIFKMFITEWTHHNPEQALLNIAIVDEQPEKQFLYPEFLLFKKLFEKYAVPTFILDPSELDLTQEGLFYQDCKIDFIYNRLTDFNFSQARHQHIKWAYENKLCVISPAPHHHQLFAKKSNLVFLSDEKWLKQMNIEEEIIGTLTKAIPHTQLLSSHNQDLLWHERKRLFFKPVSGYGSRAAYRGDKITRKVWDEICNNDYIAQELVMPSHRKVKLADQEQELKFDLRCYTYQGKIQLICARLYEGQTTNFRTAGGGFAPVVINPT